MPRVREGISPRPVPGLSWDGHRQIAVRIEGHPGIDESLHPSKSWSDPSPCSRPPPDRPPHSRASAFAAAVASFPRRPLRRVSRSRDAEASAATRSLAPGVRSTTDVAATWVKVLDRLSARGDAAEGPAAPGGRRGPRGDRRVASAVARRLARQAAARRPRRAPAAEPDRIRDHAPRPAGHAGRGQGPAPGRQHRGRVRQRRARSSTSRRCTCCAIRTRPRRRSGPSFPNRPQVTIKERRTGRQITEKLKLYQELLGKSARLDGDSLVLYLRNPDYIPCATAAGAGGRPVSRPGLRLRGRAPAASRCR